MIKVRKHCWIKFVIKPFHWQLDAKWLSHAQAAFLMIGPFEFGIGWDIDPEPEEHPCK